MESLAKTTLNAANKHTPDLQPSPYAKRWSTTNLKHQQVEVNRPRRRWQEIRAETGRNDPRSMTLFKDMR